MEEVFNTNKAYVFEALDDNHSIYFFEFQIKSPFTGTFYPLGNFTNGVTVSHPIKTIASLKAKEDLFITIQGTPYAFSYKGQTLKDLINKDKITFDDLLKEEKRQTALNYIKYKNGFYDDGYNY